MTHLTTQRLGDVVKGSYQVAEVPENIGPDYCCMGHQTLEAAWVNKNITAQSLAEALEDIAIHEGDEFDFSSWPLDLLVDYIYKKHHRYIKEMTPQLDRYLEKICAVYGHKHPELEQVWKIFNQIARELCIHMKMEELILFPYINELVQAKQLGTQPHKPIFGTIDSPIHIMKADHMDEGKRLKRIAVLTNNYTPPSDACNTYDITFKLLQEYERDMHMHIHLENNILFAKSIQLEQELISQRL
jgi:regulator of cell morphogenesis and NO signaling